MKRKMLFSLLILTAVLLSGCLYPKEELTQNQIPYKDQIKAVQTAVDDFQKNNGGILPIKTREAKTPIYQKYPIDF
jgi:PBP1b-binding outer membrane lipoprotein LpoB